MPKEEAKPDTRQKNQDESWADKRSKPHTQPTVPKDRKRYRRVRWFFIRILWHVIWWDIVLSLPVVRWFRTPALVRWKKIAQEYRTMATEMGGVLIKLGQFLSTRVDIFPREVLAELSGLQDEVPPEPVEKILHQIETDFGRPVGDLFQWFSPKPLGAASLAQAHEVRTHTQENLVVKTLRPGIQGVVETDLSAIGLAIKWLNIYQPIRKRVDLDWLANEFTRVTRNELDLMVEGRNIERFAADFRHDAYIYIPKVYWEFSANRTLTMENVNYIKIGDIQAMQSAGIKPAEVADRLHYLYMKQVFETHFVHVDPHPGNLFIKPLPFPDEIEQGITSFAPGAEVASKEDRPFQIVFVDFGMMATIPDRMRSALRDYAIGVGTRDAFKVVQSYVKAGILLKSANLKLIEEAHEALFERFWGIRVGDLRNVAISEARYFIREYREVIFSEPFQFQADMLFILRAAGILAGLATDLDENFDPWTKAIPYAERYAKEKFKQGKQDWRREFEILGRVFYKLPTHLERVLTHAQRGNLTIQTTPSLDARKTMNRLERSIKRLAWMVIAAAFFMSGVYLSFGVYHRVFGGVCFVASAVFFLWGMLR